jgi:MerR family transcriptional regulator, light-induced transcriptional regulator
MRFRVQAAHNLLDEAFGASAPDVVARDLVLPLFERVEAAGDPGVVRFAASIFEIRLLAQAGGWDRIDGPVVVLACAPREERTLALIALGLALAARHCRVAYLGAMTPARTLQATIREQDAALAVLSAERDDLDTQERAGLRMLDLLLIGRAAEPLAASLGGAAVPRDGAVAAELAHQRSSHGDDATSPQYR